MFESVNIIPNIDYTCNKFYYIDSDDKPEVIVLPRAPFEVDDVNRYLNNKLNKKYNNKEKINYITLTYNEETQKCEIKCDYFEIDFTADSEKKKFQSNVSHGALKNFHIWILPYTKKLFIDYIFIFDLKTIQQIKININKAYLN